LSEKHSAANGAWDAARILPGNIFQSFKKYFSVLV